MKADAPRVVVAHEADAIREAALRVVREAGYQAIGVADGPSATVLLLARPHPAALVVDVGLPGRLGYELVEDVRANGLDTRIVLVASVYSRTAYKRRPTSLYGADDYIEQHHIPDQLPEKLARLVPTGGGRGRHDTVSDAVVEAIREAGEARLVFHGDGPAQKRESARHLARIIMADLALYNAAAFAPGLGISEVRERLGDDLRVARELFALRVPAGVAGAEDFIFAALAEVVAARGGAA